MEELESGNTFKKLLDELSEMTQKAVTEIGQADSEDALLQAKARYIGKKGALQNILRNLANLPGEDRPAAGKAANDAKTSIQDAVTTRSAQLLQAAQTLELESNRIDITLPGRKVQSGGRNPILMVLEQIKDIFLHMGFRISSGPEVEWEKFNFEALNFPEEHPARDMQDTIFVNPQVVLRTHTSPVQVRTMLYHEPPIKVICPGRVFRSDTPDASHSPVFHQVEGLVVGKDISFAQLKGTLREFVKLFFGTDELRFRPSFFPFTEPSAEVDMRCVFCGGGGCKVCKGTGWVEILGAGMVDPNVFLSVGYDPDQVTGFAFGMGVERMAMLKYGVPDIRLYYESNVRFLRQFGN